MANIVCYDSDGQLLSHYTQWDVNQKLVIAGADISSAPDFHFLNTLQRDAYIVKSQISGNFLIASVPDELLQHGVPIIVHIYYVPGTTEYTIRIPVMPRRKPDNYIYTDTESDGGGSAGGQVYIANNLTTNDPDMALSAAQGVVIKKSIEDLDKNKVSVDQMNTAIEDALVDFDSGTSGAKIEIADNLTTDNPEVALSAAQGVALDSRLVVVEGDVKNKIDEQSMNAAISSAVENKVDIAAVNAAIAEALRGLNTDDSGDVNTPVVSPTIHVDEVVGGHNIVITDINGTQTFFIPNGREGDPGTGIESIVQTTTSTEDGGTNIITATLTDGKTTTFNIKNGSAGGRDGGNADTLGGKNMDYFATDAALQNIVDNLSSNHTHTQYTDEETVARQINDALAEIELNSGSADTLHIFIDNENLICSHSASEIIGAVTADKMVIVNKDPSYFVVDWDEDSVRFEYQRMYYDGEFYHSHFTIYEDKSVVENGTVNKHAVYVVSVDENNIASDSPDTIRSIVNTYNGFATLYYNGLMYNYQYTDDIGAHFVCNLSNNYAKYVSVATIDWDGVVAVAYSIIEAIIPMPEESDAGKVLSAGSNGQVSWASSSGKTLSEHLAEEDMILSPRQYGDKLPGEDGEPYTHVPGRIFFKKKKVTE